MKLFKICLSMAVILVLAMVFNAARADVVVPDNPFQPDENLLMEKDDMGQTIFGFTNDTNTQFTVMSINPAQDLINTANGAAVIEGVGGSTYDGFMLFPTLAGTGFTEIQFNAGIESPMGPPVTAPLTVTVEGVDTSNANSPFSEVFNYILNSNGNNIIQFESILDQIITKVTLTTDDKLLDVKQIRLGGIDDIPPVDGGDLDADDTDQDGGDLDADDTDQDGGDLDADDTDQDDADLDVIIDLDIDGADVDDAVIPEPSSILAWLVVLSGLSLYGWRRHRRNRD